MNQIIDVYDASIAINSVGEQTTTYTLKSTIRARVLHNPGNRTVENAEVVYPNRRQIQVRIYQDIDEFDQIKYEDKMYRILSIELDRVQQCKNIEMEAINE